MEETTTSQTTAATDYTLEGSLLEACSQLGRTE